MGGDVSSAHTPHGGVIAACAPIISDMAAQFWNFSNSVIHKQEINATCKINIHFITS